MPNGYYQFLKESLGIDSFIRPQGTIVASDVQTTVPATPLAFWIPDGRLSGEAEELLKKMTQAMGQSLEQVPLSLNNEPPAAERVVLFSKESENFGQWKGRTMVTHSPESLVRDPSLKKAAWIHLQTVMAAIKGPAKK